MRRLPRSLRSSSSSSRALPQPLRGASTPTFSGNGIQTMFVGGATAQAVAIDAQDRILVAGYTFGAKTDVAIARLRPRGALDRSFGGDGRVRIDLGATDRAMDVAAAQDGSIVVVGQRVTPQATTWFVIRLRSDGPRDTSFGGDGVVVTDFGRRFEHATTVAIGSDGRILVGGSVTDGGERELGARALSERRCARRHRFGGDGRVTMSLSVSGERVQDLVVKSTAILAAGYAESNFVPRSRSRSSGPTGGGPPRSATTA